MKIIMLQTLAILLVVANAHTLEARRLRLPVSHGSAKEAPGALSAAARDTAEAEALAEAEANAAVEEATASVESESTKVETDSTKTESKSTAAVSKAAGSQATTVHLAKSTSKTASLTKSLAKALKHVVPYEEFEPKCVEHLMKLGSELDAQYPKQAETMLTNECNMGKAFPSVVDHGFRSHEDCHDFAKRFDEAYEKGEPGVQAYCKEFYTAEKAEFLRQEAEKEAAAAAAAKKARRDARRKARGAQSGWWPFGGEPPSWWPFGGSQDESDLDDSEYEGDYEDQVGSESGAAGAAEGKSKKASATTTELPTTTVTELTTTTETSTTITTTTTLPAILVYLPKCVAHMKKITKVIDHSYTDLQAEQALRTECSLDQAFPETRTESFDVKEVCDRFAAMVHKARHEELDGAPNPYEPVCKEYYELTHGLNPLPHWEFSGHWEVIALGLLVVVLAILVGYFITRRRAN